LEGRDTIVIILDSLSPVSQTICAFIHHDDLTAKLTNSNVFGDRFARLAEIRATPVRHQITSQPASQLT